MTALWESYIKRKSKPLVWGFVAAFLIRLTAVKGLGSPTGTALPKGLVQDKAQRLHHRAQSKHDGTSRQESSWASPDEVTVVAVGGGKNLLRSSANNASSAWL